MYTRKQRESNKKIPLGVNGCDAELIIHELLSDETDSNSQNIMQRRNTIERDEIRLLSSQVLYLRRQVHNKYKKFTFVDNYSLSLH